MRIKTRNHAQNWQTPQTTWRGCGRPAPTVFRSPRGPTFERYRICVRLQPRKSHATTGLVKSCYPAEHILGWSTLASEQRGSGSAARGEPYWSRIDQGRPLVWRAMPERMKVRGLFLGAGAGRTTASFGN